MRHLRNRLLPATDTAGNIPGLRRVSGDTIRRRLREYGLRARRPSVQPTLLHRHRVARLQWARQHVRFGIDNWRRVLFTDESRFQLSQADGRQRVYRRRGERYADNCVVERRPYGGGGVMVWGGFTAHRRTQLVVIRGNLNGLRYRDDIVRQHIVPFVNALRPQHILQQDNARPHVANIVQAELQNAGINILPFPANSPDMAPIEHVWDALQRRLQHLQQAPTTRQELVRALTREWQNIPQIFLARLVGSMRRRCQACIAANGGHTQY